MPEYRRDLPLRPAFMRGRPLSDKGYPVPYFVAWIDGKPDFRVIDPVRMSKCVREHRCWLCGLPLPKKHTVFVIGPMCLVNRISSEPPSHWECARYAVRACPFLVRPKAHRREANLPADTSHAAGLPIARNPGVIALWQCSTWERLPVKGTLFGVGEPESIEFWTEGREARADEVAESFWSGVDILQKDAEKGGAANAVHLAWLVDRALPLLPEGAFIPARRALLS